MDTRIEEIGLIEFTGIAFYGNPEIIQFSNAWKLFGEIAENAGISRIGKDLFGLQIYHPQFPKRFELTYLACIEKEPGMVVPMRMVTKSIPASKYAVQKVHGGISGIDNALVFLYREYIPQNGYTVAMPVDFEKYCNVVDHNDVPEEIEVWVPIQDA